MSDLTRLQDLWTDYYGRSPEFYTFDHNHDLMLVGKRYGRYIIMNSVTTHFPNPEIKHKVLFYNPATMITYEGFINHLNQLEPLPYSDMEVCDRIEKLESCLTK
jgi:hypothetical protein